MKKFLLLFYFLVLSANVFGQNLVPNPSFEIFDTCPNNQGQLNYATGWNSFSESPEYFNACNPCDSVWAGCFSVPFNWGGYQLAATGTGYAGLYTYESHTWLNNLREFIGIPLTSPLSAGTRYYVSFKASLAIDNTSWMIFNRATNNLGALFSTVSYDVFNPAPIANFSHILYPNVITDTLNWTTVYDSFIADSAYLYIIIGNFYDDSNTTVIYMQDTTSAQAAYYYIDDVIVSTDSTIGIQELPNQNSPLQLFPNPTHGEFVVSSPSLAGKTLYIYNTLGEIILQQIITSAKEQINLSAGAGVYFVKVAEALEATSSGTSRASVSAATVFTQKLVVY
jgi:hypothetical protein